MTEVLKKNRFLRRHGVITLPADIRKKLDLEVGDPLEVVLDNGRIIIRRIVA